MMFIAWANGSRCVEKVNIEKYILKQFLFSWWCWIYNSFRQSVHSELLPPEYMTPQVSMKGFTGAPPHYTSVLHGLLGFTFTLLTFIWMGTCRQCGGIKAKPFICLTSFIWPPIFKVGHFLIIVLLETFELATSLKTPDAVYGDSCRRF